MTIKILFLGINPTETRRLDLGQEVEDIRQRFRAGDDRSRFEFVTEWAVRTTLLQRHLRDHRPAVVHFSGHGVTGGLVMQNSQGKLIPVAPTAIATLLARHREGVRCVVFNACHTDELAEAIAEEVDCAIGMAGRIEDPLARVFSAGFYEGLAAGESVGQAFESGRVALSLELDEDSQGQAEIPRFYGRGDAALSAASSAGQESPVGGEVPGLGPDSRARDGLEQLLRSLFGEHGLRGFMRAIPGAEGVDDELPGATASLVQLASAAVQALHERGLIERALFERLVGERPHRRGDIARTAALWNIEL